MSGYEDAEAERRQKTPYTAKHPIPTIKKYREERESRKAEAQEYGQSSEGQSTGQEQQGPGAEEGSQPNGYTQQDGHQEEDGGEQDGGPAADTSEASAAASDPRARRKALKGRKDERAEREVTDPITHLPVTIQDLTSDALKEVAENDEPFGSTTKTATGLSNKKKTAKQLHAEIKELQSTHDSLRTLFPPPSFEAVKQELADINKRGVTVGLVGSAAILALAAGIEKLFKTKHWYFALITWLLLAAIAVGGIYALVVGVRDWMTKRIGSLWEDQVWDASEGGGSGAESNENETVAWLNALLSSVWPLVNPDLFTSLADTLEDVMQASLPKMVQMVSVNDIGQGSESIRILGIRWLPTGAAARSVTEEGNLKGQDKGHENDRKVSGEGEAESPQTEQKPNSGNKDGNEGDGQTQQGDDGSQQQIAEGLEAEEGDFVNMEVAFSYRARSNKKSMKERAKDLHLYMAFYLPANIKVPVWVDLRGIVGSMRLRLQLCPDPPFFSLCTLTFLGQPKVELSCTPLSKHAMNLMDVPLISNFVQSSVDAALASYVAPKSLNLDLKDMLAGDDYKKDTDARGVLVVNIKRGYEFKTGDSGKSRCRIETP